MIISIQFENPEETQRLLLRMGGGVKEAAEEAAEDMVFASSRIARERVRDDSRKPKFGSGRYFRSIQPRIMRKGGGFLTGAIASNVKYAGVLEFGSGPHIIRPKTGKALFWPGASRPVTQVRHPGTPAFRVLTGARDEVLKDAQKFVNAAMTRKFRK